MVSGVFLTIDPPPPLHPASVSSPAPKAGDTHSPGGGSIFRKTPDIGLASIIPLRSSKYTWFYHTAIRSDNFPLSQSKHEKSSNGDVNISMNTEPEFLNC
jgi:hypothetical protein